MSSAARARLNPCSRRGLPSRVDDGPSSSCWSAGHSSRSPGQHAETGEGLPLHRVGNSHGPARRPPGGRRVSTRPPPGRAASGDLDRVVGAARGSTAGRRRDRRPIAVHPDFGDARPVRVRSYRCGPSRSRGSYRSRGPGRRVHRPDCGPTCPCSSTTSAAMPGRRAGKGRRLKRLEHAARQPGRRAPRCHPSS